MVNFERHDICEPEGVLASQFLSSPNGLPEAERSLMVAVLEDAVRCFLGYCGTADRKKRLLYKDAEAWFRSTEHSGLYTFDNICTVLDIDPAGLRRRLRAKRDQAKAGGAGVTYLLPPQEGQTSTPARTPEMYQRPDTERRRSSAGFRGRSRPATRGREPRRRAISGTIRDQKP